MYYVHIQHTTYLVIFTNRISFTTHITLHTCSIPIIIIIIITLLQVMTSLAKYKPSGDDGLLIVADYMKDEGRRVINNTHDTR